MGNKLLLSRPFTMQKEWCRGGEINFWRLYVLFFLLKNQSLRISNEETRVHVAAGRARTSTFCRVLHTNDDNDAEHGFGSEDPRGSRESVSHAWHARTHNAYVHASQLAVILFLYLCLSDVFSTQTCWSMINCVWILISC